VADLRDSIVAKPDRRIDSAAVRAKERTHRVVALLVARSADAIVGVTETIADEMRALSPRGDTVVIGNGADVDEFAGFGYRRDRRFRITHTGSFFGRRNPRPFLEALSRAPEDVVARFVGDFRRRDHEWSASLSLGDRLELIPFVPHAHALRLQRDSEALLLLLPEEGGRGLDVPSGKLFEYLAAARPIVAAVPTEGTAAKMIREANAGPVVDPEDVDGLVAAITGLYATWKGQGLADVQLDAAFKETIDRRARSREFKELLASVVPRRR
jgi:glycosyltransferase involved in cell wall biosynthesis